MLYFFGIGDPGRRWSIVITSEGMEDYGQAAVRAGVIGYVDLKNRNSILAILGYATSNNLMDAGSNIDVLLSSNPTNDAYRHGGFYTPYFKPSGTEPDLYWSTTDTWDDHGNRYYYRLKEVDYSGGTKYLMYKTNIVWSHEEIFNRNK